MNIRQNNRFFVTLVGLILSLVLGLTVAQGSVLCIETDGNITLEAGMGGICIDEWDQGVKETSSEDQHTNTIQAPHCKQCVDVPLSFISSTGREDTLKDIHHATYTPIITTQVSNVWMAHLENATESILPQPPPPTKPPIHKFLSTIILLN